MDPERSAAPLITPPGGNYKLQAFQSCLNILAHLLIGFTVGIVLLFVFQSPGPYSTNAQHQVLCVMGFQLLMAEAILGQSADNGWSIRLRPVDKRRVHAILQILGSSLALAGCFIRIISKETNFNTLHGQFALVAMVFTVASFFNGIATYYAMPLRKILPPSLSKLTHICFGVLTLVFASMALSYGLNKGSFNGWAGDAMTYTLTTFTGVFTFITVVNPCIKFCKIVLGLFGN